MGINDKEKKLIKKPGQHGLLKTWKYGDIPENARDHLKVRKEKENKNDQQVWIEFKQGSESAFAEIYNKFILPLYNYGERITPDRELIEDSIHDVFVDLWRQRDRIGHPDSIKFYLFKALKRKIIHSLTLKRRIVTKKLKKEVHDIEMVFSPYGGIRNLAGDNKILFQFVQI